MTSVRDATVAIAEIVQIAAIVLNVVANVANVVSVVNVAIVEIVLNVASAVIVGTAASAWTEATDPIVESAVTAEFAEAWAIAPAEDHEAEVITAASVNLIANLVLIKRKFNVNMNKQIYFLHYKKNENWIAFFSKKHSHSIE